MNPEQRRSVNVSLDCHARSPCRTCEIDWACSGFAGRSTRAARTKCARTKCKRRNTRVPHRCPRQRHQFLAALLYSQIAVLLNADLLQGLELAP